MDGNNAYSLLNGVLLKWSWEKASDLEEFWQLNAFAPVGEAMQDKNKVYCNIHTRRQINFYDETCSFAKLAILES